MPTVEKLLLGSQASLLTTELNSLASNTLALGSAYNNTVGGGAGDGYTLCDLELVVTYGTAPATASACSLWFVMTQDGTNYEDGGSSVTPGRMPDAVFPLRAVTTAQRIIVRTAMPEGNWKPLLKNDGTGQSMAARGNTLKVRPVTRQGV